MSFSLDRIDFEWDGRDRNELYRGRQFTKITKSGRDYYDNSKPLNVRDAGSSVYVDGKEYKKGDGKLKTPNGGSYSINGNLVDSAVAAYYLEKNN